MLYKKKIKYQHRVSHSGEPAPNLFREGRGRKYFDLKSKTKSFTLIETIIVMVLMSLVLMIAFMAFDILHKQFIRYQKNSTKVNNIYSFYTTLTSDFNNAYVLENGQDFTLQKSTRTITYSFQNNLITRKENGITDTLIKNINEINLQQDTIIRNQVTESLIFYLPKDTLTYNFNYYVNKIDSIN